MSASPSCAASAIVGGPTASSNERRAPAPPRTGGAAAGRFSCSSAVRSKRVRNESSLRAPGRAERWKVKHTIQSAHALRVALGREGAVSRDAGGDGASARTSSVVLGHLARLAAAVGEESLGAPPHPAWQTPAMRLAEAQKRASSATGAGDHREALKWHLRALALAKVHVAAVTAAGGRLSREGGHRRGPDAHGHRGDVRGVQGARPGVFGRGDHHRRRRRRKRARDGCPPRPRPRGLRHGGPHAGGDAPAARHRRACATTSASVSGGPSCEFSEQNARALRETKLEARARLGPRLLAVGRAEDAAETTRRALEVMSLSGIPRRNPPRRNPPRARRSPRVSLAGKTEMRKK